MGATHSSTSAFLCHYNNSRVFPQVYFFTCYCFYNNISRTALFFQFLFHFLHYISKILESHRNLHQFKTAFQCYFPYGTACGIGFHKGPVIFIYKTCRFKFVYSKSSKHKIYLIWLKIYEDTIFCIIIYFKTGFFCNNPLFYRSGSNYVISVSIRIPYE
ncbi:MAG: hypothetical protein BWY64_03378 [bacterium ADurb.Bin363]|nr:MAG: hypothetical protein BWY64_03378 [bacterium ADurb.Bin363]